MLDELTSATVFYFNFKNKRVEGHWVNESDISHIKKYNRLTIDGHIVKRQNMYIEERVIPGFPLLPDEREQLKAQQERHKLVTLGLSNYTKPFSTFDLDKMFEEYPEYFI